MDGFLLLRVVAPLDAELPQDGVRRAVSVPKAGGARTRGAHPRVVQVAAMRALGHADLLPLSNERFVRRRRRVAGSRNAGVRGGIEARHLIAKGGKAAVEGDNERPAAITRHPRGSSELLRTAAMMDTL